MRKHSYVSAEKYLLSREFFGLKLGLKNIGEFLDSIGSPQTTYPTIHIAGTNGKGSTAAMLASIFKAQGYKTGLFTSPHLVTLRERVRVNGRNISKASLTSFVNRHRTELSRRKLSFFEVITAMAFEHFARAKVDIAIIETGLGGRLDATNVLTPELTITTDISLDHMEILGGTISKIAYEKAGIIKPGVPHLIGKLPLAAENVIAKRCKRRGAKLYKLRDRDYQSHPEKMSLDFRHNGYQWKAVKPALKGRHQLTNSALVLKAVAIMKESGWQLSKRAIFEGMAQTYWPGRFQMIVRKNRPPLIFDVGHNRAGVAAFVDTFKILFPNRKAHIITGFVKRKEHQKMFDLLSEITEQYALVPLATKRTTEISELIRTIDWKEKPLKRFGSLTRAYDWVGKGASRDDIIVVIGSHYLVGEFFEKFGIK